MDPPRDLAPVRRRRPDSGRRDPADGVQPGLLHLFLGLGAALGIVLWWTGHHEVGKTLVLFGTGSMVAAATVLITTGRSYLRAALSQGTIPLIGFVLTLFV